MAGELKKTIKSNIVSKSTKYNNDQEKIGKVVGVNKDAHTCTVNVITRDGISEVMYNVRVILDHKGIIPWFPDSGDYVRLTEQNKRFIITGKVDLTSINEAKTTLYDDVYPDNTGGGFGFFGY